MAETMTLEDLEALATHEWAILIEDHERGWCVSLDGSNPRPERCLETPDRPPAVDALWRFRAIYRKGRPLCPVEAVTELGSVYWLADDVCTVESASRLTSERVLSVRLMSTHDASAVVVLPEHWYESIALADYVEQANALGEAPSIAGSSAWT